MEKHDTHRFHKIPLQTIPRYVKSLRPFSRITSSQWCLAVNVYFEWNAKSQMKPSQLWNRCIPHLENRVSESDFSTWLRPLIVDSSDSRLVLKTHSPYAKRVIESEYITLIRDIAHSLNGGSIDVLIKTSKVGDSTNQRATLNDNANFQKQLPFGFGKLDENLTFERHVEGQSNELARAAAMAVSTEPGRHDYNPLFLHGPVGVGKTHLMQAAGHAIAERFKNAKVGYVQSSYFVQHLVNLLKKKDMDLIERFKQTYRELDVLLVDDIHLFAGANASQQEFLLTFNTLLEGRKQVIITSDRFFKELPELQDRLISRVGAGLAIRIKAPELETRIAILHSKAEYRNVKLQHEVARFIAEKVVSSVRELEGALNSICAHHHLSGKPITISNCKLWLSDLLEFNNRPIELSEIKTKVAHYFGIRTELLSDRTRKSQIVMPRYIAISLARQLTTKSTIEIGKSFKRDHSAVIYACKKSDQMKTNNRKFAYDYETLLEMLSP